MNRFCQQLPSTVYVTNVLPYTDIVQMEGTLGRVLRDEQTTKWQITPYEKIHTVLMGKKCGYYDEEKGYVYWEKQTVSFESYERKRDSWDFHFPMPIQHLSVIDETHIYACVSNSDIYHVNQDGCKVQLRTDWVIRSFLAIQPGEFLILEFSTVHLVKDGIDVWNYDFGKYLDAWSATLASQYTLVVGGATLPYDGIEGNNIIVFDMTVQAVTHRFAFPRKSSAMVTVVDLTPCLDYRICIKLLDGQRLLYKP